MYYCKAMVNKIGLILLLSILSFCSSKNSPLQDPEFSVSNTVLDTGIYPQVGQTVYIFPVEINDLLVQDENNYYPFLPSWVPLFSFGGENFLPSPYGVLYKVSSEDIGTKVRVDILDSDSPIPLSPKTNQIFFGSAPIMSWEPDKNAQKYILQVSKFPDFREMAYSFEIFSSSGGGNIISIPLLDLLFAGGEARRLFLTEGIWYYRLRVQRNLGRPLAPDIQWSQYSPPYQFGIEWGSAPVLLVEKPKDGDVFKVGDTIKFLLLSSSDPSGNLTYIEVRAQDCLGEKYEKKRYGPYLMYDRVYTNLGILQKYDFNFKPERKKYEFVVAVKDSLDKVFRMYSDVPFGNVIFEQNLPVEFKIRVALNFDSIFSLRETKYFYQIDLCDEPAKIKFAGSSQGESIQTGILSACVMVFPEVATRIANVLKKTFEDFPQQIPTVSFPVLSFELTNPLDVTSIIFEFFKPTEEGTPPKLTVDMSTLISGQGIPQLGVIDMTFENFFLSIDIMEKSKPKIYFRLDGHIPDPKFLSSYTSQLINNFPSTVTTIAPILEKCIPPQLRGILQRFFGL